MWQVWRPRSRVRLGRRVAGADCGSGGGAGDAAAFEVAGRPASAITKRVGDGIVDGGAIFGGREGGVRPAC